MHCSKKVDGIAYMMEEHGVAGARPDLALAPLGRLRRRRPVLAGA